MGLGNPGPRYELTRHNAGFWVVDNLAEKYNIRLDRHKYFSLYGKGEVEGLEVVLAKPMTYMNESGKRPSRCFPLLIFRQSNCW